MTTIDDLLGESGGESGETFTFVSAQTGRAFTGKSLQSADEISKVFRRAKHLANLSAAKTPPIYHQYLPLSETTARGVAFIEEVLLEPKLTTFDAIQLSAKRGAYFLEIVNGLQSTLLTQQRDADNEAIETLGETYAPTGGGAIT